MKTKKVVKLTLWLAVMCLFVALLFGSTIGTKTASAEDVTNVSSEEISSEKNTNNEVESGFGKKHTIQSRVEEWFSNNFLEFLSSVDLVAVVGCITAVILDKKSNKKNAEETKTSIKENTAELQRNTASNDEVLRVANLLIDSTNALAASEEKRDVNVEQLLLLNRSVLEILVTVYVNNKNIPQATKDLVNMKYVAALKGCANETSGEVTETSEV